MSDPPQIDFALARLNLGCGRNHAAGFVNVDRTNGAVDTKTGAPPDLLFDLERDRPWPWHDGEAGEVLLSHVLEHIADLPVFMRELYRVCAAGAMITITVPHHFSDGYFGDPTHATPITQNTLNLFSQKQCAMFAERGWPNTPLAVYLGIDFDVVSVEYDLMPDWQMLAGQPDALRHATSSFANVVNEVRFVLRRV